MKKKLLIILIFMLQILSCDKSGAQTKLEKILNTFQTGNIEQIQKIFPKYEKGKEDYDFIEVIFNSYKKMTYEVKNTKVDGDYATINLDIKIPDFAEYVPDFFKKTVELYFENSDKSPAELVILVKKHIFSYFSEKISSEDVKFIEKNIDVVLKKVGKDWLFDKNNEKIKNSMI